ncbi:MAG: hypothetical protein GY907_02645, partial [Bacteroidetes bacterium]|nr:hypothetical protein [Bacteroidota bacterium]
MAINIFTQYDVNGSVNSRGKVYIGVYGQNPIDNPIDVYTDVNLTDSVSGFGIDLDFNGLPIVGGQRVNLYINESYSIQMKDEDNAYLFVDWVNVQNPVNEVEAQNWLKDLASLTPNLVLANDGNGNWTINAAALGGGDVFQAGNNTFTGDNSFQGAIGTAQYLIDTSSTPFSSGVTASFPVVVGDSGYFEY